MPAETRQYRFTNFARSTLTEAISSGDLQLRVEESHGVRFPQVDPTYDEIFSCLLFHPSSERIFEVVYGTRIAGDVITVERGKEGSTARSFPVGSLLVHTLTAGYSQQLAETIVDSGASAVVLFGEVSGSDAELSWTSSVAFPFGNSIDEYRIYRSTDGGGYTLLAATPGGTLVFTDDTTDFVLHDYAYYVIAHPVTGDDSEQSNVVELSVDAGASAVELTGEINAGDIDLEWTASEAFPDGNTIDEYEIYRSVDGGGYSLLDTVAGNVLTYVDMTVDTLAHEYAYYVIASPVTGPDSAPSNIVEFFVPTFAVFTANGDFTVPAGVFSVDALLVGGGGGGGTDGGDGGGGGGQVMLVEGIVVTPAAVMPVVVGNGGQGAVTPATNGASSTFAGYTAIGGGAAGTAGFGGTGGVGQNGASGGGGGVRFTGGGGSHVGGTGSAGGDGGTSSIQQAFAGAGGGGGGAGGNGANAPSTTVGGAGGVGVSVAATFGAAYGDAGWFGGGGGGGSSAPNTGGAGGQGGGGHGGNGLVVPVANSGGGGGGTNSGSANGNGAKGIVIIRYVSP